MMKTALTLAGSVLYWVCTVVRTLETEAVRLTSLRNTPQPSAFRSFCS